jgi:hypothetical protein
MRVKLNTLKWLPEIALMNCTFFSNGESMQFIRHYTDVNCNGFEWKQGELMEADIKNINPSPLMSSTIRRYAKSPDHTARYLRLLKLCNKKTGMQLEVLLYGTKPLAHSWVGNKTRKHDDAYFEIAKELENPIHDLDTPITIN